MKNEKEKEKEETGKRRCISEQPGAIPDGRHFLINKKVFIQNEML